MNSQRILSTIRLALAFCWLLASVPARAQATRVIPLRDQERADRLKARYVDLTESWVKEATFSPEEQEAMRRGRAWEKGMMGSLGDPAARRLLDAGEPSYEAVAAAYPGKVLDRTVLGSYSDPAQPLRGSGEEFILWWNGAISADLIEWRRPSTLLPVAEATNIVFRVGPAAELFGKDGTRFSRLEYQEGYLPIVHARYELDGVAYEETALADRIEAEVADEDVAFVRLEITNRSPSRRTAELHEDIVLIEDPQARAEGQLILNPGGATLLEHSDSRARFDPSLQRLSHRFELEPGARAAVYFKVPYRPQAPGRLKPATQAEFDRALANAHRFWSHLIARGMQIVVPEDRVNRVWRALVLQNFILADGPRMTYGSGLRYNRSYYPVESGLTGNDFALYGFGDYSHRLLDRCMTDSLTREGAGRKYQNRRGVALRQLFENYRLTRRTDVFDRFHADLLRVADEIIADRRSTMVERDGRRPLHWGLLPPDRPGVDVQASTQTVYVPAHNITNCQGLQDFGEFLVRSGRDRDRGRRYVEEARAYRADLIRALLGSVIRSDDRPPFVPIDTLYFRETPDYGPTPYDHLALGRLQGAYYHYWVDILLNYDFFDAADPLGRWITDYLEQRGGFVLGCTRSRHRPDQEAGWISNVYNGGYYNITLRRGEVERFLLGFYARLAFAMTRHALVAAEATPFIGYNTKRGGHVGATESFPNSASNGETLRMLRQMLVLEELHENRETGVLFLARAVPRAWLRDGRRIRVERAPTFFGPLSFEIESAAGRGHILARVVPPTRDPYRAIVLTLRHPEHKRIQRVRVNGRDHTDYDPQHEQVRLAQGPDSFEIEVDYVR